MVLLSHSSPRAGRMNRLPAVKAKPQNTVSALPEGKIECSVMKVFFLSLSRREHPGQAQTLLLHLRQLPCHYPQVVLKLENQENRWNNFVARSEVFTRVLSHEMLHRLY